MEDAPIVPAGAASSECDSEDCLTAGTGERRGGGGRAVRLQRKGGGLGRRPAEARLPAKPAAYGGNRVG